MNKRTRASRFRYWLAARLAMLFCLAWLLTVGPVAAAMTAPLVLGEAGKQTLGGHFSLYLDESGALDLAAVRRADGEGHFKPQHTAAINLGYVRGAGWLRVVLHNPSPIEETRWLKQSFPFQQSSILFLVHADGGVTRMDNGMQVPIAERALPNREILFPVRLEAGETATAYLRLSSNTQTKAHFTLWRPSAYVDANLRATALRYLVLGASLIVAVFSVMAWETRRRPGLLFGAAAAVLTIIFFYALDGLAMDWFPLGPELWPYQLRHLLVFLALACDIAFTSAFLDLPRYFPRLARALRGLALLALLLAAMFPWWLDKQEWLHFTIMFMVATLVSIALFTSWRGVPFARLYLLAWGSIWVGLIVRTLVDFGLLPLLPPEPDPILLGYVVCTLTLSVALYLDIRKVRADAEATRYRFLQHQLDEKQRLTDAVAEKTRELREAKALAEEASRAKTTFLSEISHELRAPLHTMLGYAQLLDRQASGEMSSKLAIISSSGAQVVRLIDDVLAFSRGEVDKIELDLEPMSLPTLVAQIEQSAQLQAAQRGNRIQVILAPGLPTSVRADEQRLTQILQNLISNACKFTQDGEVRLIIAPETKRMASWSGAIHLRFTVEDTGIGIADADQERVFTPFYRIRNARRQPGIGLGLAIARQLVRAMGGDLQLQSTPGQGSRFSFSLALQPARLEAPAANDPAVHGISGYNGPRRTLLIVDDLADNRGFMRQLCGNWGFATVEASDGNEALACCLAGNPAIDAVLVDQYMPDADGWGFLRAIRELPALARLPVILVSAAPAVRPDDFPEAMDFDGKLMKPLQTSSLARLLEQLLGLEWIRQTPTPEPIAAVTCAHLDEAEIARLREALALGKVLNLQRLATSLAEAHPECADFSREIIRMCGLVDLPGLQRLFLRVLPAEIEAIKGSDRG